MPEPYRILIDEEKCSPRMRAALQLPGLELVADSAQAEAIIFCEDDARYLRRSPLFRAHPEKCVVVSGADYISFFLPGVYSSNYRHPFGTGRTATCDYFMDEPNPFIEEFRDQSLEKKWVLAFVGGSTSWPRKRLFRLRDQLAAPDVHIESTDGYEHWTNVETYLPRKRAQQRAYIETMAQSSFFLCPRGAGYASIRLYEVLEMGVSPIIVGDGWVPPAGPDWNSFALFLPERKIGQCVELARANLASAAERGRRARAAHEQFFAEAVRAARLRAQISGLLASRHPARERLIHRLFFLRTGAQALRGAAYRVGKCAVLGAYKLTGRPFPYQLNRPGR